MPQPGKRQPRSRWSRARRSAGGIVRVRAPTSTTRPSGSCRMTTRLASHARRRDVSYETSASLGCLLDEQDLVAELFEAADVVAADAGRGTAIGVVGSEIVVGHAAFEHVPESHKHRVLHGYEGLFRAAPAFPAMVQRPVGTLLRLD